MRDRLWRMRRMPQRSHYLDWCEKIKEKYSSKGEYGFAGATLTFLQGEKESEQKKSGEERRLMLFFQNLIIYWQNAIGIKVSIGNTRVLEQSIRTALEIAMKSLSREEETKFFREVKIARELLDGKVRPEAEMRESQVFRRWQEGYTWEEISGLREIRESIDNPEKRREIRRETARLRTAGLTDRRVQQIQERTGELPESRTVYLEREERKESSPELQKTIESIKEISRIREEIKTREEKLTDAEKKFQSERAKEKVRSESQKQIEMKLRSERQKQTETDLRREKERRIEAERRLERQKQVETELRLERQKQLQAEEKRRSEQQQREAIEIHLEKQKETRNPEEGLRLGHQDHREERIPEKLQLPGKQEAQIELQLRETESYRKEDESGNQLTKREEIHEIHTPGREDVISGEESVPDREPEYEIPVKPAGNEKLELPESRLVYLEHEEKKESSSEFQKTTESIREISRIREEIKTREENLTDAEKKFQSERAKEKVRSESQKQIEMKLRSERQKQTETDLRREKERRIEAERRLERQKQVETELRLERQKQLQAEEKRRSEQQQREDIEFRLEKQKQTRTARQQKEKWNQGEEILSDRQDRRKVRLQGVLPPLRDHEVQVGSAGNEKPELPESRLVYLESEPTALSAGPKTHRIGRADQFLPLTIAGRSALTGQKLVGDRTDVIMKSLLTEKIWKNAQETVKEKRSVTEKEAVFGRSEVQFPKNVKLTDRIPAEKSDSASGKMEQRTILRHTDSIIKLLNTIDHPETKTKLQVLMGNHENTAAPVNFRNLIKRQRSITELQKILGRPENRINLQTIKFQTIMSHPENLRNRTSYAEIVPQIRIPDLAQTTKIQYIEPHGKEKPGRSVTNSEFSEISEKLIQTREETRILRRDSGYARSTLAEQEKKISGLRQELHEQMKHVNEEVKRLTDTRQQESSVRNMADRVMKELQKQFRTEKIRRGY